MNFSIEKQLKIKSRQLLVDLCPVCHENIYAVEEFESVGEMAEPLGLDCGERKVHLECAALARQSIDLQRNAAHEPS